MDRRRFVLAAAALAACRPGARAGRPHPPVQRQRGIAWDGYRGSPRAADFVELRDLGATHVGLFPFGYMVSHRAPTVSRFADDVDPSLTDAGLLEAARLARQAGLAVLFVPTLEDFRDGHWRGEVRMDSEADWDAWFASYGTFVLHYARLAARAGAVGFSVGTELRETVHRTGPWRRLIARVRETFPGWLTYAANWDDYARVPWWDAVDLIGVQAYFELGDPGPGTVTRRADHLTAAWRPVADRLQALSARTGRQVLFTEIGYKSHTASTARPWRWEIDGEPDPALQAAAYEAAFRTFWREPWFAGFYWWKWHATDAPIPDPARNFTPQGKEAAGVLRRYYGGGEG